MLEVIKYQLRDRKRAILVAGAILGGLNLVAVAIEAFYLITGKAIGSGGSVLWVSMAIGACFVMPLIWFVVTGNGHMYQVLNRNSNYLMLCIPRRGYEILGGRMLAGLIEFIGLTVAAAVFLLANGTLLWVTLNVGSRGAGEAIAALYNTAIFPLLAPGSIMALLGFVGYLSLGTTIAFVCVLTVSFIRRRKLAIAVAIVGVIWLSARISDVGNSLSNMFNMNVRITGPSTTSLSGLFTSMAQGYARLDMPSDMMAFNVPLVTVLFSLIIAAGLFAATSALIEKKMEL
jgi:hypothetical protein